MGYDVHITRRRRWSDKGDPAILRTCKATMARFMVRMVTRQFRQSMIDAQSDVGGNSGDRLLLPLSW
jgi:hypothetical protein